MTIEPHKLSHVEVSGRGIMAVENGMTAEILCRILLKKYGLEDCTKERFYPLENYLELLREIGRRMPTVLGIIGGTVSREVLLPPLIGTFERFLKSADKFYLERHRGFKKDEIGHFHFETKSTNQYVMKVDNPYPCVFDLNLLSGFSMKFGTRCEISHIDESCRSKGSSHCNYLIQVAST